MFCSDLYNTIDRLREPHKFRGDSYREIPPGFVGISDKNGVAVLSNVPARETGFRVEHPGYVLPKIGGTAGFAPSRYGSVVLQPGAVT